jgi:tetratricopeptide (TPR) repeat protein
VALHWTWFVLVPHWSLDLAGGDRERQSRLLRCVINTPIPGGPKLRARQILAANDLATGRFEEAEAELRSILDDSHDGTDLPPGLEVTLRQQLAEALEATGRIEEAAAERKRAGATDTVADPDVRFLDHQARDALLESRTRHDEAIAAYEQALAVAPLRDEEMQVDLRMRLSAATLHAGRLADALRWTEAVIALDPAGPRRHFARVRAAVACSQLGRLDDAERHARAAMESAPTAKLRAEALAMVGDYARRRGQLDEAERIARDAEAIAPGLSRMPLVIRSAIEKDRGRIEEPIRLKERGRKIPVADGPAATRRADAANDAVRVILHADLGHHDVALSVLGGAEPVLAADPRLSPLLDAASALVHALGGQPDQARACIDSAELSRQDLPQDVEMQKVVLSQIGWAALAIDEPGRAESYLRAYLDLPPDPIELPYTWYLLGSCRRRLGDEAGGRECDAKAAATHFGSVWERRARERLAAEGVAD